MGIGSAITKGMLRHGTQHRPQRSDASGVQGLGLNPASSEDAKSCRFGCCVGMQQPLAGREATNADREATNSDIDRGGDDRGASCKPLTLYPEP